MAAPRSLANSSLGQAGLDRVVSNQIVERLPNPSSKNLATRGLDSAMFRAERQQTFSPLQPRPWITNTTSSSSWRAFTIRSGGRLRAAEQALVHNRALVAWYSNRGVQIRRQLAYKPLQAQAGEPAGGQKQKLVLKRLADWLYDSDDVQRRKLKILVIDDEADQAGLDVSEGLSAPLRAADAILTGAGKPGGEGVCVPIWPTPRRLTPMS